MLNPQLHIVVALPCEARALITHYQLKKQQSQSNFDYYSNADYTIALIVSGVGKVNAAAATAYLQGITTSHRACCLLNIGIAGSGQHNVGDFLLINKIIDQASQRAFYPAATLKKLSLAQTTLVTCDSAQSSYPEQAIVDMEAYGFFQTATQFVCKEQVRVVKIISDNHQQSQQCIDKKLVQQLITQQMEAIDNVVQQLLILSKQETYNQLAPLMMDEIVDQWHFSQYQQHQLAAVLRRWQVVIPDEDPMIFCEAESSAKLVLKKLDTRLNDVSYTW